MAYDLIIFDCDGTLVDSERLYNTIASELLAEIGLIEYTPEMCFRLFSGQSWGAMLRKLEQKHDIKISVEIIERYIDMAKARMETELKAVPHIHEVLEQIHGKIAMCVGSNGEHSTVLKSLHLTGLDKFFPDEDVFSKIMVENAKPAPDLFLYCAERMEADPTKTIVFEDSVAGVKAGVAAGMRTIGFYGTALDHDHHKNVLKDAGAHETIPCVTHIPDLLNL